MNNKTRSQDTFHINHSKDEQSRWPSLKSLQITNAGEGVKESEPFSTVAGNETNATTLEEGARSSIDHQWPVS